MQGFSIVQKFYNQLEALEDEHFVFHQKESEMSMRLTFQLCEVQFQEILLKKVKDIGKLSSNERGQTSVAVMCMSTSGQYVPPMFVFPGRHEA